jgi:hypothetical protein
MDAFGAKQLWRSAREGFPQVEPFNLFFLLLLVVPPFFLYAAYRIWQQDRWVKKMQKHAREYEKRTGKPFVEYTP